MIFEEIAKYKGIIIEKDNTIKRFKCFCVVNHKVLYGGSLKIIKRKIDKEVIKNNGKTSIN